MQRESRQLGQPNKASSDELFIQKVLLISKNKCPEICIDACTTIMDLTRDAAWMVVKKNVMEFSRWELGLDMLEVNKCWNKCMVGNCLNFIAAVVPNK